MGQSLHSKGDHEASSDSGTLLEAWVGAKDNLDEPTASFGDFRVPLVCQEFCCSVMRKFGYSDIACQYQSKTFFASLNLHVGVCWCYGFVQCKCETIREGTVYGLISYQVNLLLQLVRHPIHFHRLDRFTLDFGFHCQFCCQYQLGHRLVIPKFYQGQSIH